MYNEKEGKLEKNFGVHWQNGGPNSKRNKITVCTGLHRVADITVGEKPGNHNVDIWAQRY